MMVSWTSGRNSEDLNNDILFERTLGLHSGLQKKMWSRLRHAPPTRLLVIRNKNKRDRVK